MLSIHIVLLISVTLSARKLEEYKLGALGTTPTQTAALLTQ